jgi:hypothetical protein
MKFTINLDVQDGADYTQVQAAVAALIAKLGEGKAEAGGYGYASVDGVHGNWRLQSDRAAGEEAVKEAERVMRSDYYQDVRDAAESIKDELEGQIKDGEEGESLREWLIEHIDETIDGHSRVIYTASAIECLRFSDNDGAYIDDFGTDGVVSDGGINWSTLAYSAFRQDVIEQLDSMGVDVNDLEDMVEEVKAENTVHLGKTEGGALCGADTGSTASDINGVTCDECREAHEEQGAEDDEIDSEEDDT